MKPNESCLNGPLHGKTQNAVLMQSSSSGTVQAEPIAIGNNVSNRHVDHHYQYQLASPATEALDLISYQDLLNAKMEDSSGALNSHNLIVDLNELLRRDPTLSSLEEKPAHVTETTNVASLNTVNQRQSGLDVSGNKTAQVSEFSANPLYDSLFLKAEGTNEFLSEVLQESSAGNLSSGSHFDSSGIGMGALDQGSSFGSSSPSYGMDMSRARQQMPINVNQMTLTQLNSLAENDIFPSANPTASNSGIKMEVNYFDDLDALFTTNSSPNVTLGLPPPQQEVKPEPSTSSPVYIKEEPQGVRTPLTTLANTNFWRANTDETLFGACHGPSSAMHPNSSSYTLLSSSVGPTRHSNLHRLLIQRKGEGNTSVAGVKGRPSPVRSPEGRKTLDQMRTSLSVSNPLVGQQLLSRSAPNAVPMSQMASGLGEPVRNMWARREPRQHMNSVCSVGDASSIADEVNDVLTSLSPSDDLGDIASDDEEDGQNYFLDDKDSSDDDSDIMGSSPSLAKLSTSAGSSGGGGSSSSSKKPERYFWQYNVQAKGPKGQKILIETKIEDPHVLNDIVDPVFSGDVQLQGIKHSGKARRGDGNDLTSNPRKLAAIGKELEQLNKVINDMTPVSEMPFGVRCKSRKDKNKLASRACRLKKKAQHEANKVKCIGLHEEHRLLAEALSNVKLLLAKKVSVNCVTPQTDITKELDKIVDKALAIDVAGNTTNYVNETIAKNLPYV